jgi:hypothetical protein
MVKTKSTPPGKKGTTQRGIRGRTMGAIEAALPRDIGDDLNARQAEFVKAVSDRPQCHSSVTKPRRFNRSNCICCPRQLRGSSIADWGGSSQGLAAMRDDCGAYVGSGSKLRRTQPEHLVRLTPDSDSWADIPGRQLHATKRHMQSSKLRPIRSPRRQWRAALAES